MILDGILDMFLDMGDALSCHGECMWIDPIEIETKMQPKFWFFKKESVFLEYVCLFLSIVLIHVLEECKLIEYIPWTCSFDLLNLMSQAPNVAGRTTSSMIYPFI